MGKPHPSLWETTTARRERPPLAGDLRADVAIIGGGLAGLLCARLLTDAGADCALIESDRLCGGTSGSTTAKVTLQHGLIYHRLMRTFGFEGAQMYLQANREAVAAYRSLCAGLDCDFRSEDSCVYSVSDRRLLEMELDALQKLGQSAWLARELPLPVETAGGVCVGGQAQLHPLKLAYSLAEGLSIYENTRALEIAPGRVRTARGEVRAEHVIVATHFPILNRRGRYFLKLYQSRSYVLALEGAAQVGGMYVDEADKGLSFRNHGDLLLLGGGDHRTGRRGGGWRELEDFAAAHYPGAQIVARWATQDCMSLDGVPYVGRYSRRTPGVYVAAGFNKWGMTGAMAAARLLRGMILGRTPDWAEVFAPSRSMLRPQLAVNSAEAVLGLLRPTAPRCPHMGCALRYNPAEHSWDCTCHGSRFAEDGGLLDDPANRGMRKSITTG